MPAARNQEVTVRRPFANSTPSSRVGRRAAEKACRKDARRSKALATEAGREENDTAGSRGDDDRVVTSSWPGSRLPSTPSGQAEFGRGHRTTALYVVISPES